MRMFGTIGRIVTVMNIPMGWTIANIPATWIIKKTGNGRGESLVIFRFLAICQRRGVFLKIAWQPSRRGGLGLLNYCDSIFPPANQLGKTVPRLLQ
jgi:hypothetical protein